MTLDEIFKTNPKLKDEPEVQALIKQAQEALTKNSEIARRYQDFQHQVLDAVMYSEAILIDGRSYKDTVELILTLHEEF